MGVRPVADDGQGLIGIRVRGEVQVQGLPPQEQIADGAAHEGQLVPGGGEEPAQFEGDGMEGGGVQQLRHDASHYRITPAGTVVGGLRRPSGSAR